MVLATSTLDPASAVERYDDDDKNEDIDEEEWDEDVDDSNHHVDFKEKVNFSIRKTHAVANSIEKMQALEYYKKSTTIGRDDRATSEQVLDPRTRMILFKLLSNGFFETIDGCLSTGKEANVYYAKNTAMQEFAIKIYKTSILVFKDRDKYVAGEHRWRKGYCKSNPRKMVQVWAEKEFRNYRRIHAAGIPCPAPVFLKSHVLVLEFLGQEGWPSPRLKDTTLSDKRYRQAYTQTVFIMRHLFQRCRLVHGDLSEYNMLWHNNQVFVIDVSQSVESDHPSALDFLRSDISNVNDFFRKRINIVLSARQLFEFITLELADSVEEGTRFDDIMQRAEATERELEHHSSDVRRQLEQQQAVDEAVFMSSFLPRSLNQVAEYEIQKLERGDVEATYATAVANLTVNYQANVEKTAASAGTRASFLQEDTAETISSPNQEQRINCEQKEQSNDDNDVSHADFYDDASIDNSSEDEESGEESCDEDGCVRKAVKTPEEREAEKAAKKAERKANKKMVKDAKSDRRLTKMKKKDKKRAIKKSKAGNRSNK